MSAKKILTTLMMALAVSVAGSLAWAAEMPEQVSLDTISVLFEGVEFDHALHTELGEDCSACHHHTTGTGTTDERCVRCHAESDAAAEVGCKACHAAEPFSAENIHLQAQDRYLFHIDKPGLKAAYHWNCVGCHQEMDGPTGCQDCHAKTPAGEAFYHDEVSATSVPATSGH